MIRCMWLLALALLIDASRCSGEETYLIQSKKKSKGDTSRLETNTIRTTSMTILDSEGKKIQEKQERKTEKFVYQQTILDNPKEGKKSSKLRRRYDEAEVKTDDDRRTLPYEGKTVLIEKKGDRYHFQIEGGQEITGKDAEELNLEFNNREGERIDDKLLFLPKNPVRLNETWQVDMESLMKAYGKDSPGVFDVPNCVTTGKLVRAYKKDGRQFGQLEVHAIFPIKSLRTGTKEQPVEDGAKVTIKMVADGCIDGSLNEGKAMMEMDMTMVALAEEGGNKFKVHIKGVGKEETIVKDLPKQ